MRVYKTFHLYVGPPRHARLAVVTSDDAGAAIITTRRADKHQRSERPSFSSWLGLIDPQEEH